jgi:hypothetical protein
MKFDVEFLSFCLCTFTEVPIYASLLIIIFLLLTLLSLSNTEQRTKTQYFQNLMPNN